MTDHQQHSPKECFTRRCLPGGPARLLEGHSSWLSSWGEQACLLSGAQCSNVAAVTPTHRPAVQKRPSKAPSLILIKFLSSALVGSRACVLCWSCFGFVKKLSWFCCCEWRAEIVSTGFSDILPNPSSIGHELNVNESEQHNTVSRVQNRLFFFPCLFGFYCHY